MNIKTIHTLIKVLLILSLLVLSGCVNVPGLNNDPSAWGFKKLKPNAPIDYNKLSHKNINIEFHDINKMPIKDFEKLYTAVQNNYNKNDNNSNSYDIIYNYQYKYVIGSGDQISIKMTDIVDVDGSYIVNPTGYITIPYAGDLLITNQSKEEAQQTIVEMLKKYYKSPEILVNIEQYRSSYVYISGAVRTPQSMLLSETPIRLLDFIIRGNSNPSSDDAPFNMKAKLRRDGGLYQLDLSRIAEGSYDKENFFLKKNDVIFVERNKDGIYVFGEVSDPGLFIPHKDLSLTELLSNAGISQLTANAKKVFVIREDLEKFLHVDIYRLDVNNPVNLIAGRNFYLQPSDIVFLPPKAIVKWNRVVSLLTPSSDLFQSYNPVVQAGVASTEATSGKQRY